MNCDAYFQNRWLSVLSIALLAFTVSYRSANVRQLMHNLHTPRSGENEVLPSDALEVLNYTRQSKAKTITLSMGLSKNRFLAQPITESIYPSVVKDNGQLYVSYLSEPLPAGCVTVQAGKRIRIASCR